MNLTRLATTAALLVPAVLALGAVPAVAAGNPGGGNGTIKLSEVGGPEDQSNDPKLSCSFEVQWYGFDAGKTLMSRVSFAGQGADAKVGIKVAGATDVFIGEDAAGGGTDHDATQIYTLTFDAPAASSKAGYLVKVTTENDGAKGADTKFKVLHVLPCDETPDHGDPGDTTDPGDLGDTTDPGDPGDTTDPGDPGDTTDPGDVTTDPSVPTPAVVPWDWNWQYATPDCEALTVDYPSNIPSGQANDVNIRFATANGQLTLNFHNDTDTWVGHTTFTYANHAQWPAGLTAYDVVWVQVGGTNYHWQGTVACGASTPASAAPAPADPAPAAPAPAAPAPADPVRAVVADAQVSGFRAGSMVIRRGATPKPDWLEVAATDSETVQVQQLRRGVWKTSSIAAIRANGTAKVTYPRLTKRGTYKFRVVVDGVGTKSLKVKVR